MHMKPNTVVIRTTLRVGTMRVLLLVDIGNPTVVLPKLRVF